MSTQILLNIPDNVYSHAEQLAAKMQRDVSDLFLEVIVRSYAPFPVDSRRDTMNQEVAAYKGLHPQLIKSHLGQYVAITNGQLVDSDPDPIALLKRVRQNFPNQVVLRRKVETKDTPEIRVNHPRIYTQP
ncbi:MAG: hypothetical protein H6668_03525 [Ardenticatenaceae bacterium]|nr:hypothetical protein [Ardenticatenaceae bacterium]